MDDKQILLLMRENPDESLRLATDKYASVVFTVIRRILRNNYEDVEECAADTFIKFWETAQNLDPENSSIRAYLICISRNMAINRYHYLGRHTTESLDSTFDFVPDSTDIDAQVLENEQTEVLLELIKDLPEPNREIMIRRYFHYQRIQIIADNLALPKSIIKNRIQYTKKKMKKLLTRKGVSL